MLILGKCLHFWGSHFTRWASLLLVRATHLVTLSQVIKTALGEQKPPNLPRQKYSDASFQTVGIRRQVWLTRLRCFPCDGIFLRLANSTQWRKVGRGRGRGEGHLRPPGFTSKFPPEYFHLKFLYAMIIAITSPSTCELILLKVHTWNFSLDRWGTQGHHGN